MFAKNNVLMNFVQPTERDVLCGRGRHYFNHAGNMSLRSLIQQNMGDYLSCKRKSEKTRIIRCVMHAVLNNGGRFLKFDAVIRGWFDGGLQVAKIRVGVAFRDAKVPTIARRVEDMKPACGAAPTKQENAGIGEHNLDDLQKIMARPSSAPSSSLWDLIQDPSFPSASVQSSTRSLLTRSYEVPSISILASAIDTSDPFEPHPVFVTENDDVGLLAAQCMLKALWNTDDHRSLSSCTSQEDSLSRYSDMELLEDIEPLTDDTPTSEAFLGNVIRSNEIFLEDFLQTLSTASAGTDLERELCDLY